MNKVLLVYLILISHCFGDEMATIVPGNKSEVEMYYITEGWGPSEAQSSYFIFKFIDGGYSLRSPISDKIIRSNIPYIKTSGMNPRTVQIDVVNKRFLIFGETTEKAKGKYQAVTHVYDLTKSKHLHSSSPYDYDGNIPLSYSVRDVIITDVLEKDLKCRITNKIEA